MFLSAFCTHKLLLLVFWDDSSEMIKIELFIFKYFVHLSSSNKTQPFNCFVNAF